MNDGLALSRILYMRGINRSEHAGGRERGDLRLVVAAKLPQHLDAVLASCQAQTRGAPAPVDA